MHACGVLALVRPPSLVSLSEILSLDLQWKKDFIYFGWPDSGAIRRLAQRNGTGIGIREIPVGFGRYRILLLYLERAPSKWAGTSLGISAPAD